MVRAIPFGKLQKIWVVIWGEQFLVCLGVDHLTFDGGMGEFRKKCAAYCFWEEKKSCKEIPGGEKYPTLKKDELFSWPIVL